MKRFRFRLQVVLDMRENELEQKQMEMARIVAALNLQQEKLRTIIEAQEKNSRELDELYNSNELDIIQIEGHKAFSLRLSADEKNQQRIIDNTKAILRRKQEDVLEAHKKVETLKKLKEKQEKQFYKEFLQAEIKEIDDITTARFKVV